MGVKRRRYLPQTRSPPHTYLISPAVPATRLPALLSHVFIRVAPEIFPLEGQTGLDFNRTTLNYRLILKPP